MSPGARGVLRIDITCRRIWTISPIVLRAFPHQAVYVIGLGSNLLVRDGGLRGIVIALHARLNDLQVIEKNESGGLVYAGAGVACAKVARFSAQHDLAGAEFLAGIPGTIGGALAMNAGCYGSETWQFVERVKVIDRSGQIFARHATDYETGYRSVKLQHQSATVPQNGLLADFSGCHWGIRRNPGRKLSSCCRNV
jgi:UDP-N-acetylmuramate dehydrogenase